MRILQAILPSHNRRYEELAGSTSHYSESDPTVLPAGLYPGSKGFWSESVKHWDLLIHPEGKVYYHDKIRRIITSSNILLSKVLEEIEESFQQVTSQKESFCKEHKDRWPEDPEVFLELNGLGKCDYYITSVQYHTVFWLSEAPEELDLPSDASATTIRLKLEEEFWCHISFFPMHWTVSVEDESVLRGILIFTCADKMTAPGSTSYLTCEECLHYLSLLGSSNLPCTPGSRTWLIARVMTTITRNRNQNDYGQEGARLDRFQKSITATEPQSSFLRRMLDAPLIRSALFYAHVEYDTKLQLTAIDDVVLPQLWKDFMSTCLRDWNVTMAMALVVILANIPLFGNGTNQGWRVNATMTSTMLALGSFGLAMYQYRTHRGLESTHAYEAAAYLLQADHATLGYTPQAIYLSFSFVLLIWSIIIFSVAILSIQHD